MGVNDDHEMLEAEDPRGRAVNATRVLTIKNPHAYALAAGWKDVENRSWRTMHEGLVALHAGLDVDEEWQSIWPTGALRPPYVHGLPRGQIIAVAHLAEVHHADWCWDDQGGTGRLCSPWAQADQFHWVFKDAVRIDPIPYTGGLGLRHLDADVETAVLAAMERALA